MRLAAALLWLAVVFAQSPGPEAGGAEHFGGSLKLEPAGDGINMRLLEAFSYTDGKRHFVTAGKGFLTDGASIPRILWTIVGSPFTGKYLNAAVIHDAACVSHEYTWQVTHRIFYDAMIDSGVDENYAKVLYYGVRLGGPRWKLTRLRSVSREDLKAQIAGSGGVLVGEIHEADSVFGGIKTTHPRFSATVSTSLPAEQLSEQQIRDFQAELARRNQLSTPVSATEIEQQTEPPAAAGVGPTP